MKRLALLTGLGLILILMGTGMPANWAQAQTVKDEIAQKKEEYQDKMAKTMADFQQKLNDLKDKAAQKTGNAQAKMEMRVNKLEQELKNVNKQLDALKCATGYKWETLKDKTDAAMEKLEKAFDKATGRLKD